MSNSKAIFSLVLLVFWGCGKTSDPGKPVEQAAETTERKAQLLVEGVSNSMRIPLGDTLTFRVSREDSVSLDSLSVSLAGGNTSISGNEVVVTTAEVSLGRQTLAVEAYVEGTAQRKTISLEFLSDLVPKEYTYERVTYYTHDPTAFTEGLFYHNGFLYESTGRNGQSGVRKVELETGRVVQQNYLADKYFGEGIALWKDQITQLTYKSGEGFVFGLENLEQKRVFNFSTVTGEGWGMTTFEEQLMMSDGSEHLYLLNPETLTETRRIKVYDHQGPVKNLNELEYIEGVIYANIWLKDDVVTIDPETGKVLSRIDLSGLLNARTDREVDVLNGIAYDPKTKRLFVTGKLWPRLYEIRLREKSAS